MPPPSLALHDVSVRFGGLTAVANVDLTVGHGERLAVIGPNGAGKTTLFRVISGEQRPTQGRVEMAGNDVTRMGPNRRARRGLGRTYQVTSLFDDLTVHDNLVLALMAGSRSQYRCWWPLRRAGPLAPGLGAALERVGLSARAHDTVDNLSHGEQRQLEIGMALASDPVLLLLDEPAAGLSGSERPRLAALIQSLSTELTIVLIEHDIDMAFEFADRVVCMDDGTVVANGTPDEVRADERVRAVYLGSGSS